MTKTRRIRSGARMRRRHDENGGMCRRRRVRRTDQADSNNVGGYHTPGMEQEKDKNEAHQDEDEDK
eukprot:796404-Pyramimonas_sp.AAC.2